MPVTEPAVLCNRVRIPQFRSETPVAADLKDTPCAPNDYFKIDCNTCYCNMDRTGYLCTENLCTGSDDDVTRETTRIPLADDKMLIISPKGVKLVSDHSNTTTDAPNDLSIFGRYSRGGMRVETGADDSTTATEALGTTTE
ncbi:unnamed protein product [Acanthoscelides obtectus]|uniref:Pacifastin domain-containing protein n=1 Tax=Acanthoscelides obtectus TaxID=200917 RepID=A0A9P0PMC0_ACAOB|nr:unnamed protein product [Acanthoscelides obtectus]